MRHGRDQKNIKSIIKLKNNHNLIIILVLLLLKIQNLMIKSNTRNSSFILINFRMSSYLLIVYKFQNKYIDY